MAEAMSKSFRIVFRVQITCKVTKNYSINAKTDVILFPEASFLPQIAIGVELRLPTTVMVALRVGDAMDAMLLDQVGRQDNADGKASDNEQEK